jgi:HlyD family secretion protein
MTTRKWILVGVCAIVAAAAAIVGWREFSRSPYPDWIAKSNGRLEAEQVDITSKLPGRIIQVLVDEGQMVDAGTVLVRLDATEIAAQLGAGEAQVRRAEQAIDEAEHAVALRLSVRTLAMQEFDRAKGLYEKGTATAETLDQRRSALDSAEAAYQAGLSSVGGAKAALEAAQSDVARLKSILGETVLTAPRRGRIQYKLMQAGEVAGAGSRILTLIDLADVYMTVFLPANVAAPLAIGDEARLILDPVPQYVVPANVSFVAAEAQFTPKSVETAEEREQLMFRVKLQIAPDLLQKFESQVKTGVRGVGFVRTRRDLPWPASLETKLPQ